MVPLGYELPWDGDNPERSAPGLGVFTAFQSSAAAREREKNTREALWKTCWKKTQLFPAQSGLHLHWSRRRMGYVRNAGKKRRSAGAAGYEEREGTPGLATRPRPSQREKTKSKLSWKYLFTSYLSGFGTKQVLA